MKTPTIDELDISTKDNILTIKYRNSFTWTFDYNERTGVEKKEVPLREVINEFIETIEYRQQKTEKRLANYIKATKNALDTLKNSDFTASTVTYKRLNYECLNYFPL